ncbi:hypothetical protein RYX36_013258 [Vicia faba]
MASSNPKRNLTDKQHRKISHISSSPPPVTKRSRKPRNYRRVDDHDLYLMWVLSGNHCMSWAKYIVGRMLYCNDTKKAPLFYSSFVQLVLEANEVVPKKDDKFLTLKILDYGCVSNMRYYRDSEDGSYFYLEESSRKVYDNKIVDPPVDHTAASASSTPFG